MHEDITNNTDAYICSFYMFKDKDSKGGKLQLGAPWDFNLAFGAYQRVGGEKAEGWRIPQSANDGGFAFGMNEWFVAKWIQNIWKDNSFQQKYKARWAELRPSRQSSRMLPTAIFSAGRTWGSLAAPATPIRWNPETITAGTTAGTRAVGTRAVGTWVAWA